MGSGYSSLIGIWEAVQYLTRNCGVFWMGLACLVERGYDNVIIQFDSLEVVKGIQEGFVEGLNPALVRRIHQLLLRFGRWSSCHIHREDNQDADRLVMFEAFLFGGRS
ncbi:hypothetical protein PVK06_043851 [Gossypium arboreum]|uniref:RNase H type-1 domain-containing protein n=1 Tax=Gossypium arboreum TaxID=29729 RepID=A0ABR0MPI1_GOSAR|nr:hypothetical protein PVK06_043851 [Gossypium arboreum]